MIYFFTGENSFEIEREVQALVGTFQGEVQRYDPDDLTLGDMQDVLQGQTLFSDTRLVIVKQLSENKPIWDALSDRLTLLSSDVTLILIEAKPDKRTKTYKELARHATMRTFVAWTQKDQSLAAKWVSEESKRMECTLTQEQARHLVQRAGVDQWQLFHALEKLQLVDTITVERMNELIEPRPDDNIFAVLDTALRGDVRSLHVLLADIKQSADPYQLAGLLYSQIMQLATLAVTDKSAAEVAKDIGAHPFVLSKFAPHAQRLTRSDVRLVIDAAADCDMQMKSTGLDPWLLVEQLLIKIARR